MIAISITRRVEPRQTRNPSNRAAFPTFLQIAGTANKPRPRVGPIHSLGNRPRSRGTVDVASSPEGRFALRIPEVDCQIVAMTYRILIVDDSKLARLAVARLLNDLVWDWPRLEAANVDDALLIVKRGDADVVLTDYQMPGRTGLDLLAALRSISPDIPIAMISANRQPEIVEGARKGDAAFMEKPLDPKKLKAFLDRAQEALKKHSKEGG